MLTEALVFFYFFFIFIFIFFFLIASNIIVTNSSTFDSIRTREKRKEKKN